MTPEKALVIGVLFFFLCVGIAFLQLPKEFNAGVHSRILKREVEVDRRFKEVESSFTYYHPPLGSSWTTQESSF